jgi:CheY-like chemotaxis protein
VNERAEIPVVLLVEDRADDALLVKRAFQRAHIVASIAVASTGSEAVMYLRGRANFANRAEYPLPQLVLLDLKLPGLDGFEVLEWIRSQPSLKALRVVVLTSSENASDINRAYSLGANSFLVKPADLENFAELGRFISGYWLEMDKGPEVLREQ